MHQFGEEWRTNGERGKTENFKGPKDIILHHHHHHCETPLSFTTTFLLRIFDFNLAFLKIESVCERENISHYL